MAQRLQAVSDDPTDQNFRALSKALFELTNRVAALEQALERAVSGSVSEAGAVVLGEGFAAEKTATGHYTITLTEELPTTGIMVVSPKNGGAVFAPTQGTSVFKVQTMNPAETEFQDRAFTFEIEES